MNISTGKRCVRFHKTAYVDIMDKKTGKVRTCHLKEIKNIIIGNDKYPSEIDGFEVSINDACEIRLVMLGLKSFKEFITEEDDEDGEEL